MPPLLRFVSSNFASINSMLIGVMGQNLSHWARVTFFSHLLAVAVAQNHHQNSLDPKKEYPKITAYTTLVT